MCDWQQTEFEMEDEQQVFVPEQQGQRYGGPQADEDDDEDRRKREERERKKAEVRKRLEEAGRAKKAKKGFLTPERKKKLRKLLMQKAAEDLKQQQVLKEQERQRILGERCKPLPDGLDAMNDQAQLEKLAKELFEKIMDSEGTKYDVEYNVRQKDFEINELTIAVNDLRGKFVKPTLKKVSKYDNKLKKYAAKKEDKIDFRAGLKIVKSKNEEIMELLKGTKEGDEKAKSSPDWSKKSRQEVQKPVEIAEQVEEAAAEE